PTLSHPLSHSTLYPLPSRLISFHPLLSLLFFSHDPATTEIYTLSLHDALPICSSCASSCPRSRIRCSPSSPASASASPRSPRNRSEEHTSELQSACNLVCRLLLEKKKKKKYKKQEHT